MVRFSTRCGLAPHRPERLRRRSGGRADPHRRGRVRAIGAPTRRGWCARSRRATCPSPPAPLASPRRPAWRGPAGAELKTLPGFAVEPYARIDKARLLRTAPQRRHLRRRHRRRRRPDPSRRRRRDQTGLDQDLRPRPRPAVRDRLLSRRSEPKMGLCGHDQFGRKISLRQRRPGSARDRPRSSCPN